MRIARSFIPWVGGKSKLLWLIRKLAPPWYPRFIDVFGGSGTVKRTPEKELQRLLEELYEKYVPADTREYLDSKNKPAVRPRPRRTAKGGRTAQTQDNNNDQDNPGQGVSTGYDMGGRHDEKV